MRKPLAFLALLGLAFYFIRSRLKIFCRKPKIILPMVDMPEGKGLENDVCIKSPWSMTGPVWDREVSAGGLTLRVGHGGNPHFPENNDYVEPTIANVFGLKDIGDIKPGEVTLLVIDDFEKTEILHKDEVTGNKFKIKASHGHTVASHIRFLLEDAGFKSDGTAHGYRAGIKRIRYEHPLGRTINLDLLDLNLIAQGNKKLKIFTTRNLTRFLQELSKGRGQEQGDYFSLQPSLIINMSFVLFPCKYAMIYKVRKDAAEAAGRNYNYQDLVNEIIAQNRFVPPETIRRDMTHIDPSDGFLTWLRQTKASFEARAGGASFFAIAASGNYGFDFSFYPGASDYVISVSGFDWKTGNLAHQTRASWTNSGDLLSPAAWFTIPTPKLSDLCNAGNGTCALDQSYFLTPPPEFTQLGYRGTSFASPSVAAYLAMKLDPGTSQFPVGPTAGLGFVFASGTPVRKTQDDHEVPHPAFPALVFRGDDGGKI